MTDALRPGEVAVAPPERTDARLLFIGRIRTTWAERRACPRRGALDGPLCRLELDEPWPAALDGLVAGATLQVLYWMHLARRDLVRQAPRGREGTTGTFALRSPLRPNPIASSLVRLVGREGPAVLTVRGLDCVDGTPLLDIKPERCPVDGTAPDDRGPWRRPTSRGDAVDLLVNIDVPDLEAATAFYAAAFGLTPTRRLGEDVVEMGGWAVPLYLLRKKAGSIGAGGDPRRYGRHWTPVHLDMVVPEIAPAMDRAIAAGARAETGVQVEAWGRTAVLADPFGHGFCLIEFTGRGYDEPTAADRP